MIVIGIDPGYTQSAYVVFNGDAIIEHAIIDNDVLRSRIDSNVAPHWRDPHAWYVFEQMAAMGMAVGAEVLETCVWTGRFIECCPYQSRWARLKRVAIKRHLCGQTNAKDANVRQALIDRFGPSKEIAIGTKATPGPLYGIASHEWAALAVAVTFYDQNIGALTARP